MSGLWNARLTDRASDVQPDVQDVYGAGGGLGGRGVSPARDCAGDLRELSERPPVLPAAPSLRHCPDWEGVPQRDHPGELHLSNQRVRANGDAVLRAAGHRWRMVRSLA